GMVALVAGFYFLHWVTRGKGFGLGDVKLAAPLALILGWPKVLVGVFLAFLMGSVFGLGLIMAGRRKFGQILPFAPFLILGTGLALVFGQQIWQSYLSLL
ncbi:MAG TPA: prepilin peptidase, partial [Candidatus Pacebacteria bacterium]|nr:prepilin peptidase [Candidatus Paceibacterota bacterium]